MNSFFLYHDIFLGFLQFYGWTPSDRVLILLLYLTNISYLSDWKNHELHWWRHWLFSGAAEDFRYHIQLLMGVCSALTDNLLNLCLWSEDLIKEKYEQLDQYWWDIGPLHFSSCSLKLCYLELSKWRGLGKGWQPAVLQFLSSWGHNLIDPLFYNYWVVLHYLA